MANKNFLSKEKVYKEISEQTDIPAHKVEEAVKHQFSCTAELMKSGDRENLDFPSIRLQYFGKFEADERVVKHIQRNANKDEN